MSPITIKGIAKGYLKTMGYKLVSQPEQDGYGILQRFKEIENDIWGGDPPDKEDPMRVFIDGLINIISEIREGIGKKDAEAEVKNANKLVVEVEKLTQGKMISKEISRKTTAEIVEGLEKKSEEISETKTPGKLNVFETFFCCLLMADSLEKNEGDVFSGVFKSWNRLQKLDQIGEEELQKSFKTETAKINRNRSENITRPNFTRCYASVKKLLPEFEKITQTNDNLEHHLKWEVEDVKKMLTVFGLSRPSFETENGTNRLQTQLANLWNQLQLYKFYVAAENALYPDYTSQSLK
ncbi:hypothetical protein DAPPUDRAFT_246549 [Daphnia pulex]|uniref:Uncharacterized protein n=1 Tax=Daphnia pulex TaxID=6669 RepID=E9GQU2_DAPPU|nr:hypothetical protein DAPPUDRAFT_246549 [Daphnia pulex]|eukprot:EFX78173.1 hypothetical protein DAPPUDRAFT_246549 [Daphnia pulex]